MKKTTPFLILLFFSLLGYSQSFNYQAVVRDAAGDPIVNQSIGVQVQIFEGVAPDNLVYTETHTITSSAQGVISLAVGTGTTANTFNTINWSQQNQWIGIAVDVTGGTTYVNLGTTKLQQVPYALYAANSGDKTFETTNNVTSNASGDIATDDFVFGSTQLADDTNTMDDNIRMFFDKSKGAFRAGFAENTEWDDANVGPRSVAFGNQNTVSAFQSFAMGAQNNITGPTSATFGTNNTITGIGTFSTGERLTAEARSQVTIGYLNTAQAGNALIKVPTDRLFVIGNGFDETSRSDALVMLKNGNTTLNGQLTIDGDNQGSGNAYTLPAQDGAANQIMSTDGSGNVSWINQPVIPTAGFSTTANVTSNSNGTIATDDFVFGSSQLDDIENNAADNVRMYFDKSKGAFRAGSAVASDGFTGDWNTGNTGSFSVAMGRGNLVQGIAATSFGTYNNAGGENAFATGFNNLASRPSTVALGANNSVSGFYAVGIGRGTQSTSYGQHTVGLFSEYVDGSDSGYVATDPLFIIGNGPSDGVRSNALVMRKNGNTQLNGSLTIDGDNAGAGAAYTLPAQDGTANQIMSTDGSGNVSWINNSVASTGLEQITEGSNTGWRLAGRDPAFYGNIGDNAVDLSISEFASTDSGATGTYAVAIGQRVVASAGNSIAIGDAVQATNNYATAIGYGNIASGYRSFAAGESNTASASSSTALGYSSTASGRASMALGRGTTASGVYATTTGFFTNAEAQNSFALGRFNVGGGTADSWVTTDPLFEIGNGSSSTSKSNALTILKNGNAQLNGSLTIDGDNAGSGAAYTLPAQDGTANQVMSTDGAGNVSWTAFSPNDPDADPTNEIELPAGGSNGQILRTNGSGGYSWVNDAVNDADNDPTNEIELPAGGTNGQVLISDGSGGSQWTSNVSAATVTTPALTITGLPAFAADLDGTKVLSGAGSFNNLSGWRTSDASLPKNLFDNGNHFNETTGEFTAPVDGFYQFNAQVRFDGVSTGYIRLLFGVNGTTSLNNGLHAIEEAEGAAEGIDYHTLNVSGVMKLNANDKVTVIIYTSSDTSWSINDESGFNGYLISRF
ncbi:C1q-like domain-containing protein [Aquimarina litoralis]|uniref:C1q-like domain-containing protein n=1 Tax=Aquimarina litoralis TaxID=584605 RepID=UPI001C58B1FC|nr:hypothetical protein [Aquimarina litoralis]MBW1294134.1 hypothetical protein [Aquimarina litoralis]